MLFSSYTFLFQFLPAVALAFAAAFLVMMFVLIINIGVRLLVRRTKFV